MVAHAFAHGRPDLVSLVDRLCAEHPQISRGEAAVEVLRARDAVGALFLSGAPESAGLLELVARRQLRLRLGLDREAARLDPEHHQRRSPAEATPG